MPGPAAALSQWLMESFDLVSLLLDLIEEYGHRLQVRHTGTGWGCLVAVALGGGAG